MANSTSAPQPESVDRIRDIIFGPTMRDYDQRFEGVQRDLSRLQTELDRLNELLAVKDAAQAKNLQAVRQELRQANTDLRTEARNELARLTAQLADQNTAQTGQLQSLRDELREADRLLHDELTAGLGRLDAQLTDQATAQSESLQTVRQELRSADADLRDELRQIAQRLTDTKTDRSLLGDLFIELGNHIKGGGGLTELLKGLEEAG